MNEQALTFDPSGRVVDNSSPFLVFRLSWVAYLRETWAFFLRLLVMAVLSMGVTWLIAKGTRIESSKITWPSLLSFAGAVAWTLYSIALTNSVRLFTNDGGVWMQRGVFPWEKGVSGVQWRDVGQACCTQGFANWALRSYNVQVSHRFTAGAELNLRNVHRGNLAVEHINGIMGRLQGRVMPGCHRRALWLRCALRPGCGMAGFAAGGFRARCG